MLLRPAPRFGWIPDTRDVRDDKFAFKAPAGDLSTLPQEVKWWQKVKAPPFRNQLQTSGCVGFSGARTFHYREIIQGVTNFIPSPMFLYGNARVIGGNFASDSGAQIRDMLKSAITDGVCSEDEWPFDPAAVCIPPSERARTNAQAHEALAYRRVDTTSLYDLCSALAAGPVVGGIPVYTSFMDARSGFIPMPADSDTLEGGHALCWTGYSIPNRAFWFDNSWGDWGMGGRGCIPFDYITDMASDFWLLSQVE